METLRDLLNNECGYRMQKETMDGFLSIITEIRLKNKEPLIPYGKVDDSIYIVKDGLIRRIYFDGLAEKTYAFSANGTVVFSFHSFYKNIPSVFQYESCGESVVFKASKRDINELMRQSHDFTTWLSTIFLARLYHWEKKAVLITGDATERFEALLKNRPEITDKVPLKIIASYIGVSPQWLSTLRNKLMPSKK